VLRLYNLTHTCQKIQHRAIEHVRLFHVGHMRRARDRHLLCVRDAVRQRILIDPVWWWHDLQPLPFWDELQRAVYEDRCIRVRYESYGGDEAERVLEPYSLVAKASLWYLIARRDGELRTYRVSRLKAVTLLDEHFQRTPDFDLPAYWRDHIQDFLAALSEYAFTLRIDSRHMASSKWYTPGRTEILDGLDDDGWLTARLWVESEDLAVLFVLTMGDSARILEPSVLRIKVLDAARALVGAHGGRDA
jgi:predicted DNA-binding transcriptional regulator YafY